MNVHEVPPQAPSGPLEDSWCLDAVFISHHELRREVLLFSLALLLVCGHQQDQNPRGATFVLLPDSDPVSTAWLRILNTDPPGTQGQGLCEIS